MDVCGGYAGPQPVPACVVCFPYPTIHPTHACTMLEIAGPEIDYRLRTVSPPLS